MMRKIIQWFKWLFTKKTKVRFRDLNDGVGGRPNDRVGGSGG
jgi:hypothetical protein